MSFVKREIRAVVLVALWLLACRAASDAQPVASPAGAPAVPATTESPTSKSDIAGLKDSIVAQAKKVEAATDLDDEQKTKLRQLYDQSLVELGNAEASATRIAEYQQSAKTAPSEIERLKERSSKVTAEYSLPTPTPKLDQLQKDLAETEAKLETAKQALALADKSVAERSGRQASIPKTIAERSAELQRLSAQIAAITAVESPEQLASRAALLARQIAVTNELEALRQELVMTEAQANLLPLRRDDAAVQLNRIEKIAVVQRDAVAAARQLQAAAQEEEARIEAQRQSIPALKTLADENQSLAAERIDRPIEQAGQTPELGVPSRIREVDQLIADASKTLQALKKQATSVRNDVETVGLTKAVATLLRQDRLTLPDTRKLEREIAARQDASNEARFHWLKKSDKRADLGDISAEVDRRLAEARQAGGIVDEREVRGNLESLLVSQRELLDNLIRDYDELFHKLYSLSVVQEELINATDDYRAFIDERILWAVSTNPVSLQSLQNGYQSAAELGDSRRWSTRVFEEMWDSPWSLSLIAFTLLLIPLAFPMQASLRHRVTLAGLAASKRASTDMITTIRALLATIALSVLWAGIVWLLAWQLVPFAVESPYWHALLVGLQHTALFLVPFQFVRQICRPSGLAEAHFEWPVNTTTAVRHGTQTILTVTIPLVLLVTSLRQLPEEVPSDSLGRMAFLVLMLIYASFAAYLFRPRGEVASGLLLSRNDNLLRKADVIWCPLLVALPLGIGVAAAAGYYYTAFQLTIRLLASLLVIVFYFVFAGIADRSLLIIRRRLAMKRYREKRAQEAEDSSESSQVAAAVENEVSLTQVDKETRRVVKAILTISLLLTVWLVWVDVIPALGVLRRIELWDTTIERSKDFTQEDGTTVTQLVTQKEPVSLADALLAVLVVSMSWIASRNVTGVVEILGSSRLAIDRGTRYAIATMARYVLIVIGIVSAAQVLGIGWAKVQWLVAGAAVGLGFGLQEIFANLISGLMILVERPIRVGDVVTVDTVSGVVSRIRIRATTITAFDRKELIIPNKEFITQPVMNWTLTDQVTRIDIQVGIAYGSDIRLAREILLKLVRDHALVLADPEPSVFFDLFGDSTLNFTIRAFVAQLDHRLPTVHDLHVGIDDAFRAAKIEIAFPQRDLHIRSMPFALPHASATAPPSLPPSPG